MAAQPRCQGESSDLTELGRLHFLTILCTRSPSKHFEPSALVPRLTRYAFSSPLLQSQCCADFCLALASQAVLGITISPEDERSHPNAPLLSAGTRRHSACMAFLAQAHQACFESSLAEEVSVENLAAILSLMQMSICKLTDVDVFFAFC